MRQPVLTVAALLLCALSGASTARGAPPARGLALAAEARLTPEGGLALKATFRSADGAPVTFFVPEFASEATFPTWRAVRSDGATFRPYPAPFQSMWTVGDQGSLVEVAGERTWSTEGRADLWVAVGAGSDADAELTPLPLEAGRYRVLCSVEKADARIPVGREGFQVTERTVAGLWTGRAEAAPLEVEVPRRPEVRLRVDAPRLVEAGTPFPLSVVLRNDTEREQTLTGMLRLAASTKPLGTVEAFVLLGEPVRVATGRESTTLTLAPGAERAFRVDLQTLTFRTARHKSVAGPLADLLGQGLFHLEAAFGPPAQEPSLRSNALWRYVAPRP